MAEREESSRHFGKAILASVALIVLWALMPALLQNPAWENALWYKLGGMLLMFIPVLLVLLYARDEIRMALRILRGVRSRSGSARGGKAALAEVLRLGEAAPGESWTVNDQPLVRLTLRVFDHGAPPYEVALDTAIPRLEVPRVLPGARLPVRVDPGDAQRVTVDWERL